jgi:hypothetical protein
MNFENLPEKKFFIDITPLSIVTKWRISRHKAGIDGDNIVTSSEYGFFPPLGLLE